MVAFHPPFGTTKAAVLQPALRRRSAQQRRHPTRRPPSMRQMRAGRAGSAPPKVRRVRILSSLQQSCAARHARRRRRALPRSRRRLPGMTQQRALQLPAALLSSCERLFEALQCAFDGLEVESKEMGHWFECAVAGRAAEHGQFLIAVRMVPFSSIGLSSIFREFDVNVPLCTTTAARRPLSGWWRMVDVR